LARDGYGNLAISNVHGFKNARPSLQLLDERGRRLLEVDYTMTLCLGSRQNETGTRGGKKRIFEGLGIERYLDGLANYRVWAERRESIYAIDSQTHIA
jgi:hypothetical protein